jgi:hypothetical protein
MGRRVEGECTEKVFGLKVKKPKRGTGGYGGVPLPKALRANTLKAKATRGALKAKAEGTEPEKVKLKVAVGKNNKCKDVHVPLPPVPPANVATPCRWLNRPAVVPPVVTAKPWHELLNTMVSSLTQVRPLLVGTGCSGLETPNLALEVIQYSPDDNQPFQVV